MPDKDMAKLYVQFFRPKITPNLNVTCKNELIYMGDFEAVQKPRSCVLSGLKTRLRLEVLNLIIHSGSDRT